MFKRLRTSGLAGAGAVLLLLSLSGVAAGAAFLADILPIADPAPLVDTTPTFEDKDGNGVDDDCQETVVADAVAQAAAKDAADLDRDGVISTSEAARSGRIGGKNCNHGGYVSTVAHSDDTCEAPPATGPEAPPTGETPAVEVLAEVTEPCAEEPAIDPAIEPDPHAATEAAPATACDPAVVPTNVERTVVTPTIVGPNAHGKAVSEIAKSDTVGGKNCNHGGAVSEIAKDKAAHDAAKAAAKAARDAAKAERKAAHDAAKAARDAARAAKHHGKPEG